MNTQDILLGAGEFTAEFCGRNLEPTNQERFVRGIENALKLRGREILAQLKADDRSGLFLPVTLENDGKERRGCVLTLQDRAIIAWGGAFRSRVVIVSYDSITSIAPDNSGHVFRGVRISADEEWTLHLPFDDANGVMSTTLMGVLDGSIQFEHG